MENDVFYVFFFGFIRVIGGLDLGFLRRSLGFLGFVFGVDVGC